jgi:hypothetical protein
MTEYRLTRFDKRADIATPDNQIQQRGNRQVETGVKKYASPSPIESKTVCAWRNRWGLRQQLPLRQ